MLPYSALALISAAILAYEVLLVRLLSIVQWHHFAYMAISIALLGFGVSGTVLTLARRRLQARLRFAFVIAAAVFALTAVAGFLSLQQLPFNALEIVWEPSGLIYLGAMYGLLAIPFTAGASAIGLAFLAAPQAIGRVYLWNLVGSGAGALGVVLALTLVRPMEALLLVAALALLAALVAALRPPSRSAVAVVAVATLLGTGGWLALPPAWAELNISQYKALSTALRVQDAGLVREHSGPLGLVSVVESPSVPFRYVPGLSLNAPSVPPEQIGVFTDGDAFSAINRFDGGADASYLAYTTDALVYALTEAPSVLILGAGGGSAVSQAMHHGAAAIDAVELNPDIIRLVTVDYADFAGRLHERPGVSFHMAEARNFVARTPQRWDAIHIPLLDALGSALSGVQGLSESYIYTVEAFELYLRRLQPDGWLSLTRWLRLPPSDTLRLVATAIEALEREGVADPGERLVVIRGPDTATVLVKQGAVDADDVAAVRQFAATRSFDLAYYPGIEPAEANRRNILPEPYLFDGISALLGAGRETFVDRYKLDIAPSTDDRPYFFDFFKWRTLPELLSLRRVGGAALLDWGKLILFATLVQALLLSAFLILLPLALGLRRGPQGVATWRLAVYFTALGLAFLFVEIAFIQRFVLFLGHPIYAVAVCLAGFLVFAGIGSGLSGALQRRLQAARRLRLTAIEVAVVGIIAAALIYLVALGPIFERLAVLPDVGRVAVSLLLIAPMAFFMGMPFPLGLSAVSETDPQFVPWAWGLNGCASVVSAVLATIVAMHLGFSAVVVAAAVLYGLAAAVSRPMLDLSSRA
jgi:spermidine synthase